VTNDHQRTDLQGILEFINDSPPSQEAQEPELAERHEENLVNSPVVQAPCRKKVLVAKINGKIK